MKHFQPHSNLAVAFPFLLLALVVKNAYGEIEPGQVLVKFVTGEATYSTTDNHWQPIEAGDSLSRNALIKTGPASTADLIILQSGTVLRMMADTTLGFTELDQEQTGEETITETSVKLLSGAIVGSQRKLPTTSHFDVLLPGGVATIRGTEYYVRADGAVTVISGAVSVHYNLPGNGGSVKATVPAGFSFNPATGEVVATTPDFLANILAHIDVLRNNARVFKTGGATLIVKPVQEISPATPRGNDNNGINSQPADNPQGNRGTGPKKPH
jgi:hypothetical protein